MVAVMAQIIGQVLDIFKDSAVITEKARIYPPSAYITIFGIFLAMSIVAVFASFYCRETHGRNIT